MTEQTKPDTRIAVRVSHRKAVEKCLDSVSGPFRRSALSAVLYPLTAPRNRNKADKLADMLISELAKKGSIQRHGHLHWVKVSTERTLLSGRSVPELAEPVTLPLTNTLGKRRREHSSVS